MLITIKVSAVPHSPSLPARRHCLAVWRGTYFYSNEHGYEQLRRYLRVAAQCPTLTTVCFIRSNLNLSTFTILQSALYTLYYVVALDQRSLGEQVRDQLIVLMLLICQAAAECC